MTDAPNSQDQARHDERSQLMAECIDLLVDAFKSHRRRNPMGSRFCLLGAEAKLVELLESYDQ